VIEVIALAVALIAGRLAHLATNIEGVVAVTESPAVTGAKNVGPEADHEAALEVDQQANREADQEGEHEADHEADHGADQKAD